MREVERTADRAHGKALPAADASRVGPFIVFEGCEGSGKSTQAERLARRLADGTREVITTYEPGGTAIGEELRQALIRHRDLPMDPTTELFLFGAARAQLTREVVLPALRRNAVVVCDRYAASSLAYQGYGRGVAIDTVRAVNDAATLGLVPDIVFL
ncbi:MAG: dTMP kinase, partial [Chloroflexota bacterium]